jgi:hypothetical protein
MKQHGNYYLMTNPLMAWTEFALGWGQMMATSAQVVGQRTGRMLLAGANPGAADRKEFVLMGAEKSAAAAESMQAMAHGMFALSQQLAAMMFRQMFAAVPLMMSVAASSTPQQSATRQAKLVSVGLANSKEATSRISSAIPRIAHKGLRPIHSKAAANRKRLAKG